MGGWFINEAGVPVELDCRCPNKPHEKDTVWLHAEVPVALGMAFDQVVDRGAPDAETMIGMLGSQFIQHGVRAWTFVDEKGEPVPVHVWNLARFAANWDAARPVAEKASDLYSEKLMLPLVTRLSESSPSGPTGRSTSAKRAGSRSRPRRSRRSTTATTQPRLQVMTSSDGDSSSSPKRKSA